VDPDLRIFILVVVGGALGAAARFGLATAFGKGAFPYATLVVNVLGCFAAGLLIFYAMAQGWFGADVKAFAVIGFLGAFTTMSTFSVDLIELVDGGQVALASGYVAASVFGSIGAAFLGRAVALALAH